MNKIGAIAVLISLLPLVSAPAQETPPAETPATTAAPRAANPRRPPQVPLRIQLTISRLDGEKKIGNLPFTLMVNTGDSGMTSLRTGVNIPVRMGSGEKDKDGKTSGSYQYRNVGTNIDCRAEATPEDGRYRIETRIDQTSVSPTAEKLTAWATDLPFFRSFNTSFWALLRDGQTATHVIATDSISGEVVRIDIGLTVVK
jgi:hypothetical protein